MRLYKLSLLFLFAAAVWGAPVQHVEPGSLGTFNTSINCSEELSADHLVEHRVVLKATRYDINDYPELTTEQVLDVKKLESKATTLTAMLRDDDFDVIKFTEALVVFITSPITRKLPVKLGASLLPKLDLYSNMVISKAFVKDWVNIPGYNKVFNVPNLEYGRARWFTEAVDRQPEDPVIFYSHGGGYLVGLYPTFVLMMNFIYKGLRNDRLSILMIDYTLTLDAPNPTQLIEYVETYNELAKTSNNIIQMGDSAGAHLALQFLRHQNYKPFKGVVPACKIQSTGGIYLSPWVNVYPDDDDGTMVTNLGKDVLTAPLMRHATDVNVPESWLRNAPFNNMYKDKIDWDSFMPESVFVSRGQNEVLYDSITEWTKLARLDDDDIIFTDPHAIHDAAIFTPDRCDIMPEVVKYLRMLGY